ncbi:MAG: hypothetical protein ABIH23_00410, partial [bacterium]
VSTPGGGKQYWSSNWFPNRGRSYTHSTYEMAYAEELNFALTNYLGGRAEEAYALIRAALCGIYNGPTPGGLSCHSYTDGRQRANDEFADAISMFGRTVVEGLFGIIPKRQDGFVQLTPQFPDGWPGASIKTPHFSYRWKRQNGLISIVWDSPIEISVHLRLPVRAEQIDCVTIDGKSVEYDMEPGIGLTWLLAETPESRSGVVEVSYIPMEFHVPDEMRVRQGSAFEMSVPLRPTDPQGILGGEIVFSGEGMQGVVATELGPGILFFPGGTKACPYWLPVRIVVEPHSPKPVTKVWSPPKVSEEEKEKRWFLVDLDDIFNARLTEVLERVAKEGKPPALPASQVGFNYRKDHYYGPRVQPPSDDAWRNKVGSDGVAWTTDGIPFKTSRDDDNAAVVSLVGEFPAKLEFPVGAKGKTLYLMLSGITFPAQSHVVNLKVTLTFEGETRRFFCLRNPFEIGDCWSSWCGRFHDTAANGFENIGGRFGPMGSIEVDDMTKPVAVDTEAHLAGFDLPEDIIILRMVEIEAVANGVVFGVMGATVLK